MFGIIQRRFKTQIEWEDVWNTPVDVPTLVRDLGMPGSLEVESTFSVLTFACFGTAACR
jgi:hypothetical protein